MELSLLIPMFHIVVATSDSTMDYTSKIPDLNTLVDSKYFVDKSDILKAFFAAERVTMVSAPARFGKSVNLQIIKKFCEISVDQNGNRLPRESSPNYKLFQNHNLNILKDKAFVNKHFGNYPVVFVDLQYLDFDNFTLFMDSFKEMIYNSYSEHSYVLNTELFTTGRGRSFRKHFKKSEVFKLKSYELYNRIGSLSSIIHTYFNRTKCILLFDGYDHIVHKTMLTTAAEFSLAIQYIFDFLTLSLYANPFMDRAFINSRIRLQPQMHNVTDIVRNIPFLTDPTFAPFYGFTEKEVERLLHKEDTPDELDAVRAWYGGFAGPCNNYTIYNPYSVLKYLKHKQLKGYWNRKVEIGVAAEIFLRDEIQQKYRQLICNNTVKIGYLGRPEMEHISLMKIAFLIGSSVHYEFNEEDVDLFLQFMAEHGYFSIVSPVSNKCVYLKIPNSEIWEYVYSKRNQTQNYQHCG